MINSLLAENELYKDELLPIIVAKDTIAIIDFLKNKGLLRKEMNCHHCSMEMVWTKRVGSKDGYQWKCSTQGCNKFKRYLTIRNGSFLSRSKMYLNTWLHAMYLWSVEESEGRASKILSLSIKTTIDIYKFFRDVCQQYFQRNPIQLGGSGLILNVDESCFAHQVRHKGPAAWVFGIVDSSVEPAFGYLQVVESRSPAALMEIIYNVVRPGSVVHTDEWQEYSTIQELLALQDKSVDKRNNFVAKYPGVHKPALEAYWGKHKSKIVKMRGISKHLLPSYLSEMMWRERFGNDAFNNLCDHIKDQYS